MERRKRRQTEQRTWGEPSKNMKKRKCNKRIERIFFLNERIKKLRKQNKKNPIENRK